MPGLDLSRAVLLVQLCTTLPLVGLIWFVQIVAYPLFAQVGDDAFRRYHAGHSRLITFVVAPLMVLELGAAITAAVTATFPHAGVGAALVVIVWLVTFLVSVPQHEALARGFDARAHRRLVRSNWIRTGAWTVRGGLVIWAVSAALG